MLLQIHDELILNVLLLKKTVINFIKEEMESVKKSEFHTFSIPLEVSVNSGYTWGEAH